VEGNEGGAAPFVAPPLADDDPLRTDGDAYRVVMENEEVRVLRFADAPGDVTRRHRHPSFVLVALGPFHRRFTLADGTHKERAFATGDFIWFPAQTHTAENTGATRTFALVIELKRW
jgi:quercetin dioxygenase-like cupin family protein